MSVDAVLRRMAQQFIDNVWKVEDEVNKFNMKPFPDRMASELYNALITTHWCIVVTQGQVQLKGSQANKVQKAIVTEKNFGSPLGTRKLTVYAVPRGVKVNIIRQVPRTGTLWGIYGDFNKGTGAYDAHYWVPNWASKPWE